jgi:PhoH-like ATPase
MRDLTDPTDEVDDLIERNVIQMEPLTYMRGRSIPRQYIICDEVQNLTPKMVQMIGSRIGWGSKLVFTGDPEQIDNPYLDASSNGLTCFIEKSKHSPLTGHITLKQCERSNVADLFANIF